MIVGFTGTQRGMTLEQRFALSHKLMEIKLIYGIEAVHHGGCVGADEEFDRFCAEKGIPRVVHRGSTPTKWAECEGAEIIPSLPNLVRNEVVVRLSDFLIAAPHEFEEVRRSGTWATVRYARKAHVPIIYLWRSGATTREG